MILLTLWPVRAYPDVRCSASAFGPRPRTRGGSDMRTPPSMMCAAVAFCGWLGWSGPARGDDRPAKEILADIDKVELLRFDPKDRGDQKAIAEFDARRSDAEHRRGALVRELWKADPENDRLPELLSETWRLQIARGQADRSVAAGKILKAEKSPRPVARHPGRDLAKADRRASLVRESGRGDRWSDRHDQEREAEDRGGLLQGRAGSRIELRSRRGPPDRGGVHPRGAPG